jgi:hypothetical protein
VLAWNCVMTGFVAAAEPVARGGMVPLHVHGPHAWFGEQALLGGQASQVDYVCMTQVELIGMRQSCLENALREEPLLPPCPATTLVIPRRFIPACWLGGVLGRDCRSRRRSRRSRM